MPLDTEVIQPPKIQTTWYKDFRYLYLLLCGLGFIWIAIHLSSEASTSVTAIPVCIIQSATGVACPSCGTTRSIIGLLGGDPMIFLRHNPLFALIVLSCMLMGPFLIFRDFITGSNGFNNAYRRLISWIEKPMIRNSLIFVVLLNWLRLIYNGI